MYAFKKGGAARAMALYQIQSESQNRPIYASWDTPVLKRRTPVILQWDGVEVYGEVLDVCPFLQTLVPGHQIHRITRPAGDEDQKRRVRHRQLEKEAFTTCRDWAQKFKLALKLVQVSMLFDETRLVFFYTAEERVDFRELVRELAHRFRIRIEMRQIGVRDEAKLRGGYGHCGRPLCCASHLRQFYPIGVKMAKDQGLSLNPAKISGLCGRLMCCLRYECPSRLKHAPPPVAEE